MKILSVCVLLVGVALFCSAQKKQSSKSNSESSLAGLSEMDKVYSDETHCLTSSDMRNDADAPISCYCRDAVIEARYVYGTYVIGDKDLNLKGVVLRLQRDASEICGSDYPTWTAIQDPSWRWQGPEVIRTYPPDNAIKRMKPKPMMKGATTQGRWVPFTVQLVYRDKDGHVVKTEDYSSREFLPDFSKADKSTGNR